MAAGVGIQEGWEVAENASSVAHSNINGWNTCTEHKTVFIQHMTSVSWKIQRFL
jgi:hypothetical protein